MRFVSSTLAVALIACGVAVANPTANATLVVIASPKAGGVPPGLAKKGGVPPGLAKQFGAAVPEKAYVAIDPRYDDRAWFLIDGRWVLRQGFDQSVRVEVRSLMTLPPVPEPPVPLPSVNVAFRVVLFH
jgi:hypothetical protein